MKLTIMGLVALASLSACSSLTTNLPSNDTLLQEFTEQDGRACIRNNSISGYGMLDNDVISVDARRKEYYLLTTLYRCNSLDISHRIAFKGNFSQFCGGAGNTVITGEEVCPIKAIYKFPSKEDAFAAFEAVADKRDKLREALKKEAL
jgi:hypothetical protein